MKVLNGRPDVMKKINRNQILNLIREKAPISRTDVATQLDMSLPTVMRAVDYLIEEKFVVETVKGQSVGGRKPMLLEINPGAHYIIGVTISRQTTAIVLNLSGEILARQKQTTKYGKGPEIILNDAFDMIETLIQTQGISIDSVDGIGIGVPGSQFKSGEAIQESFFKGWEMADIQTVLKDRFPVPVIFENIAKVLAVGEQYFGECQRTDNFIKVIVDNGVGCGMVLGGSQYKGVDSVGGEFGHMVLDLKGKVCYCGNRGCIEMYASIPAILDDLRQKIQEGASSSIRKDVLDFGKELDFCKVVTALENNDETVAAVIRNSGYILGVGLANLINLYNPEKIILDGEVCQTCPEFVEEAIKSAREHVFSQKARDTVIRVTQLGEDSSALGAAALVMTGIFSIQ